MKVKTCLKFWYSAKVDSNIKLRTMDLCRVCIMPGDAFASEIRSGISNFIRPLNFSLQVNYKLTMKKERDENENLRWVLFSIYHILIMILHSIRRGKLIAHTQNNRIPSTYTIYVTAK